MDRYEKPIDDEFRFLLNYGFEQFYFRGCSFVSAIKYRKDSLIIYPGYDLRECVFDVSIHNYYSHDRSKHIDILQSDIGTEKEKDEIRAYMTAAFTPKGWFWRVSTKDFRHIVYLHADFVRRYIDELFKWCER